MVSAGPVSPVLSASEEMITSPLTMSSSDRASAARTRTQPDSAKIVTPSATTNVVQRTKEGRSAVRTRSSCQAHTGRALQVGLAVSLAGSVPAMPAEKTVHELSDHFVDAYAALDPIMATGAGIAGHDDRLTDYSPEGHQARAELAASTLRAIEATTVTDPTQQAAKDVFAE